VENILSNRTIWIKYLVIAGLAIAMFISWRLWITDARYFPLTPLLSFIPPIPAPFDFFIIYILALFFVLSFIYPDNFVLNLTSIIILTILAITDVNRLQPWFHQYFVMLLIFTILQRVKDQKSIVKCLQLFLMGLYFWSGFHKINTNFFEDVAPWMAKAFGVSGILTFVCFLLPFAEIFVGVGLFFKQTRKTAMWAAIGIHFLALLILSPLGHNNNMVIWPWNIILPAIVFLLFYKDQESFTLRNLLTGKTAKLIVFLAWILPALHVFNLWPAYLSFNLYSGNTNNGVLYISDNIKDLLPEEISPSVRFNNTIQIKEWSANELKVPAYPEKQVYLNAFEFISDFGIEPNETVLHYQPKKILFILPEAEFH
jgi:hypothetical protein